MPCTVVNVALAAAGGVAVGALDPTAGVAAFVASLFVIAVRGYLVPGTPTLTRRYLPARVRRWFGKAPAGGGAGRSSERLLLEAGVLVPDADGRGVQLAPSFREDWRDRVRAVRGGSLEGAFAAALDGNPDAVTVDDDGESVAVYADGVVVGPWRSRAAAVADVAAWQELSALSAECARLDVEATTDVLDGLRAFVERCPVCDGPVTLERAAVDSCCASFEVATSSCEDCGAGLVETRIDGGGPSEPAGA